MPKKTFETVIKSGNEAIIQVKENQPTLLKNCKDIARMENPVSIFSEDDEDRNRREIRTVRVFNYEEQNNNTEWIKYLKSIIEIKRIRWTFDTKEKIMKASAELAYYASTTGKLAAKEFGAAIRNHWGIENRNHYVRDVSMNEDKSRIRVNPENFIALRSFSLNIMRNNNVKNVSSELYKNALNMKRIFKYII